MKVNELFDVKYGVNLELMSLETVPENDVDGVNFVARTSANNGVVVRVKRVEGLEPQPAGLLSCAGGGSVLSTFVQIASFYSGRDLYILTPKKKMTLHEKLFYCMSIQANAYRYNYGRQANKTLKDIELPDSIPEWVNKIPIKPISTAVQRKELLPLNVNRWEEFRIGDLFSLERCKNSSSSDLLDGDGCFYLGAKKSENGVMRRVACDESVVSKGNCIVFIGNGQGSVGYANYMNDDFIGTADLTVGYSKHLNKYNGMFIVTLLDLERPKYSFGRKWSSRMADTFIKLPAKDNAPDWDYMEQYIKALQYSDRI